MGGVSEETSITNHRKYLLIQMNCEGFSWFSQEKANSPVINIQGILCMYIIYIAADFSSLGDKS